MSLTRQDSTIEVLTSISLEIPKLVKAALVFDGNECALPNQIRLTFESAENIFAFKLKLIESRHLKQFTIQPCEQQATFLINSVNQSVIDGLRKIFPNKDLALDIMHGQEAMTASSGIQLTTEYVTTIPNLLKATIFHSGVSHEAMSDRIHLIFKSENDSNAFIKTLKENDKENHLCYENSNSNRSLVLRIDPMYLSNSNDKSIFKFLSDYFTHQAAKKLMKIDEEVRKPSLSIRP